MNRHIFSFLLLLGVSSFLLHQLTEMPYIVTLIVVAPMAIVIGFISVPPIYLLSKAWIADDTYGYGNVLIVVAVVESIIMLGLFFYSRFDIDVITENLGLKILALTLVFDFVAFFREYYKRWIYIALISHIAVFMFVVEFYDNIDLSPLVGLGLYYLLLHTIFTFSYIVLRHIIQNRFPYVSKWKI